MAMATASQEGGAGWAVWGKAGMHEGHSAASTRTLVMESEIAHPTKLGRPLLDLVFIDANHRHLLDGREIGLSELPLGEQRFDRAFEFVARREGSEGVGRCGLGIAIER